MVYQHKEHIDMRIGILMALMYDKNGNIKGKLHCHIPGAPFDSLNK